MNLCQFVLKVPAWICIELKRWIRIRTARTWQTQENEKLKLFNLDRIRAQIYKRIPLVLIIILVKFGYLVG